jgi:osmotically-inducible protein OsmY
MNHTLHRVTGAAAAIFILAALPAAADDRDVKQRVLDRLAKSKLVSEGAVEVSADQGAVILEGAVTTVAARREAERAARKESKVVENRLRVLPEQRTDAQITKDVRKAILRYPNYGVFDSVELGVDNGVVTLAGSVYRPNRKSDLDAAVARVAGVRAIENQISVQSLSPFDDQLRRQIYARIYGSIDFAQYSNRANPPIRIIVDRGRVTLTGFVQSPVERVQIESIARQTLAFDVVSKLHVDGEQPEDAKPAPIEGPALEI